MSKNLIKLAQQLVENADEAIQIQREKEQSSIDRQDYYSEQLKAILNSSQEILLEYSQLLKESLSKEKRKTEKIQVRRQEIKDFVKKQKKTKEGNKKYKVYKTNFYSKISNFFMEDFAFYISKKYPEYNDELVSQLTIANIRILSKTYISLMLFSTFIAFPIVTVISFIILINLWIALLLGATASMITFFIFKKYPLYEKSAKAKLIKQELTFALIHMSAVASSGAPPMEIFKLLVESKEYKHLNSEFERVLNYINIFGYNLTTSLKSVASTSASPELRELLYGLASTIETGGGIKEYLKGKADEALVKYKLDQKKYLEVISTYSEIYTGVLIAAPLLFLVTLAILERISPNVAGIPINTIAILSVFVLLPILNIIFILLLEGSKTSA
jgi:archaeal flagellar protein FlaJ